MTAIIIGELSRIHKENYSVYGIRKMWHAMARAGWNIGRDQVARLMRAAGLQGVRRGRKVVTTTPAAVPDHRPDLVQRNFRADAPHRVWVADITYVRIATGFAYTAFITDVYSRRIVGWSVVSSLRTQDLPMQALEQALLTTNAAKTCEGLFHHSDRGTQYVSLAYTYQVSWSEGDGEYVATVVEFPSLSWLDADRQQAECGLLDPVSEVVGDMEANGEIVPEPLRSRSYSGKFNVRTSSSLHRRLVIVAKSEGISFNALINQKLASA
ncbi:toxin-antitoxin system HicB family antitoxin [Corynebacterium ulcerans]|nr:toxin-antitoxin system HicB family antitoxin [Corynebacterium ulcerans]